MQNVQDPPGRRSVDVAGFLDESSLVDRPNLVDTTWPVFPLDRQGTRVGLPRRAGLLIGRSGTSATGKNPK